MRPHAIKLSSAIVFFITLLLVQTSSAQEDAVKSGLTEADWAYEMAPGVTRREVTYYSDDVACFAIIFYPKDFDPNGKTPAIVLGQGWTGTHHSIAKYAARFAEKGLVAMAIDYRGWGNSNGFATIVGRDIDRAADETHRRESSEQVIIKRTRLLPMKQVEDYRNAISYIQGEPGVDPDRIGVWGSSYAGGHTITVAGLDARVKVIAAQVPAVAGKGSDPGPFNLRGPLLTDAIARARTGQGDTITTGFSNPREVDRETYEKSAEYRPFHYLQYVGNRPVLMIAAGKEQLFNNDDNAKAAIDVLSGPKKYIVVPGITHFEMYINEAFEISSNAAADWFVQHLSSLPPES
jgi:hypothetical protein